MDPRGRQHAPNLLIFLRKLEQARRFERRTPTLARLCSPPELRPRSRAAKRSFSGIAATLYEIAALTVRVAAAQYRVTECDTS